MLIAFRVIGRPVPQGSMVASYNKAKGIAHVHHVQGAALALWRAELRNAAQEAGAVITAAPVSILVTFGMPRPIAQYGLRNGSRYVKVQYQGAEPAVAPDLDKLVRAVLDALTGVCYNDDAQVTTIVASKKFGDSTEVVIIDEGRPNRLLKVWQKNGSTLDANTAGNTVAGQLHLSDLWRGWSE